MLGVLYTCVNFCADRARAHQIYRRHVWALGSSATEDLESSPTKSWNPKPLNASLSRALSLSFSLALCLAPPSPKHSTTPCSPYNACHWRYPQARLGAALASSPTEDFAALFINLGLPLSTLGSRVIKKKRAYPHVSPQPQTQNPKPYKPNPEP